MWQRHHPGVFPQEKVYGHTESSTCIATLPPHYLTPRGLVATCSSTGSASYRRCECVSLVPAQVPKFFYKKALGLAYKWYLVMYHNNTLSL